MPGNYLRENELKAATIVGAVLDGIFIPRDLPGARDGTHDFDVLVLGRCVALEVTRAADERVLSTLAAAMGRSFPAPGLATTWRLTIPTVGPNMPVVKDIVKAAPALIAVLERANVEEFNGRLYPGQADSSLVEATALLSRLGVSWARTWPEDGPPRLFFSGYGGFGSNPDEVNRLAAEHAAANAAKLRAADADERHVFVWIDPSYAEAEVAMHLESPPDRVPELPGGVDVVWVANASGHLWRCRPPGGWEDLPCPRVEVAIEPAATRG